MQENAGCHSEGSFFKQEANARLKRFLLNDMAFLSQISSKTISAQWNPQPVS